MEKEKFYNRKEKKQKIKLCQIIRGEEEKIEENVRRLAVFSCVERLEVKRGKHSCKGNNDLLRIGQKCAGWMISYHNRRKAEQAKYVEGTMVSRESKKNSEG